MSVLDLKTLRPATDIPAALTRMNAALADEPLRHQDRRLNGQSRTDLEAVPMNAQRRERQRAEVAWTRLVITARRDQGAYAPFLHRSTELRARSYGAGPEGRPNHVLTTLRTVADPPRALLARVGR